MSLINVVYASAPADQVIIHTLEIKHSAIDTIRICADYADHELTLETSEVVTFEQSGFDIELPNRDTSGNQVLTFAVSNVTGEAQAALDDAMSAGGEVTVTYRAYLASDTTTPAEPPTVMTLIGATFQSGTVQLKASYFDLLNTAWPRLRYTSDFSPAIKYLS